MGDEDAPRCAPALGSRESGNDDGGWGGLVSADGVGRGSRSRGRGDSRIAPTVRWGNRRCYGVGSGGDLPLWIPASAGMTMWVCGPTSAAGSGGVRFPLRREGRFTNRPYGALGESGMLRGRKWGRPAPLDTGFRRYDDVGVRADKCCW